VLEEGDVAVEVAGRPVLVLQGDLPTFRNLTPTLTGPDVRQLEEALTRLGLDPGTVDDVYDAGTEAAVAALYLRAGYTADEPTVEELERVEVARRSVRDAETAVSDATTQTTAQAVPASTRLELDRAVRTAEAALADARAGRDSANADAASAVTEAQTLVPVAQAAAESAAGRLASANGGTHPDTGLAPTPEELADLNAESEAANQQRDDAVAAQKAAIDAVPRVKVEQDRLVADAETDLEIARANRSETLAAANSSDGGDLLARARQSLADEQKNLDRLEAEIGVSFPAAELVFLPTLPSEVQAVNVEVGDVPQGAVMTVTGSGVQITSTVSAADRSLLAEGNEALMEDADLGLSIPAVVSFVADDPGGQDVSADRYIVRFEPVGELPEEALNQNLRVTIPFASTEGAVLAVPLAALSAGADGTVRVEVERADGTVETVTVTTGLNARALGLVEITPVEGDLAAGDRVIVGRNTPGGTGGDGSDDVTTDDTTTDDTTAPAEEGSG
jgi:peptidoglycan hydrolase-like protein with peptidoglycan-binding domain